MLPLLLIILISIREITSYCIGITSIRDNDVSSQAAGYPQPAIDTVHPMPGTPLSISIDPRNGKGILFSTGNQIWAVTPSNSYVLIAGDIDNKPGYSGDGGSAISSLLHFPAAIRVRQTDGAIFIADTYNCAIRMIDSNGNIQTILGLGPTKCGYSGDGGLATNARINRPWGLALHDNKIYVGDTNNNVVRMIDSNGIVTTIAGNYSLGQNPPSGPLNSYLGDEGAAVSAYLSLPSGIEFLPDGRMLIADYSNYAIRMVDTKGIIHTVAGYPGVKTDPYASSTLAKFTFSGPNNIAVDLSTNSIAVADENVVRIFSFTDSMISSNSIGPGVTEMIIYGSIWGSGYSGDGNYAANTSVSFGYATDVAYDEEGNLLCVDYTFKVIRRVDVKTKIISTVLGDDHAGRPLGERRQFGMQYGWSGPQGIAVAKDGMIAVVDSFNSRVLQIDSVGRVSVIAGVGSPGTEGDGGLAKYAQLNANIGNIAYDHYGNLYIADYSSCAIRKVDINGYISTIAGMLGICGYSGDGGLATAALLNSPNGVSVDQDGNVYIADTKNYVIRMVNIVTNVITTFAGTGKRNCTGDYGSPAASAEFDTLLAVTLSPSGKSVLVTSCSAVRAISISSRTIRTWVGTLGNPGYYGEEVSGTSAQLSKYIYSIASYTDPVWGGIVFIADTSNTIVRAYYIDYDYLYTIGGNKTLSDYQNPRAVANGDPTSTAIGRVGGVAVSPDGSLFISDLTLNAIWQIYYGKLGAGCPAGYYCSCGRGAYRCPAENSSYFCPANSAKLSKVSEGFFAVAGTGIVGENVQINQVRCMPGHVCSNGIVAACPAGTYDAFLSFLVTKDDCRKCSAGTYLSIEGQAVSGPINAPISPCLECPQGTFALDGAISCTPCGFGEFMPTNSRNCLICPGGNTSASFPGAHTCLQVDPSDTWIVAEDNSAYYQRTTSFQDGNAGILKMALHVLLVVAVIMSVFSVPIVILVAGRCISTLMCCNFAKKYKPASKESFNAFSRTLMKFDSTSQAHIVQPLQSPRNVPTVIGGTFSLLGIGAFFAAAGALTVQYFEANNAVTTTFRSLDQRLLRLYSEYLPLYEQSSGNIFVPTKSGMVITIDTMGQKCGTINATLTPLAVGKLVIESTMNKSSGAAHHSLLCTNCIPTPLTQLMAKFDGTCRYFSVSVAAIGAYGDQSAAAFYVQSAAQVETTIPIGLQVVQDFVDGKSTGSENGIVAGGVSATGLMIRATQTIRIFPASEFSTPGGARVILYLPVDTSFSAVLKNPKLTVVSFVSGVLGLVSIMSISIVLLRLHSRLPPAWQIKPNYMDKALNFHSNAAITVNNPPTSAAALVKATGSNKSSSIGASENLHYRRQISKSSLATFINKEIPLRNPNNSSSTAPFVNNSTTRTSNSSTTNGKPTTITTIHFNDDPLMDIGSLSFRNTSTMMPLVMNGSSRFQQNNPLMTVKDASYFAPVQVSSTRNTSGRHDINLLGGITDTNSL